MNVIETKIPGLLIFEPKVFVDERGWFMESFNQKTFEIALKDRNLPIPSFVQDNHSFSSKGVLRGLHYQVAPYIQGKLVRVIQGCVFDVAVDIRQNSPTFLKWVGVILNASNHRQFWIPEGFAHGFLALEDNTQLLYKTTSYYSKTSERSIIWNDKNIGIDWKIDNLKLNLSEKDLSAKELFLNDLL